MSENDPLLNDPLLEAPKPRWRRWLPSVSRGRLLRWALRAFLALLVIAALYYPVGMLVVHRIDDDPNFQAPATPEGASRAVAIAAALIDREVGQHGWPSNDPFFMPGWALDNMPNYQQGIVSALSRFVQEMRDQISRVRATSQADPDLEKAAGQLSYSPTVWIFDFSTSWAPTASSEQQYLAAARLLKNFNDRLSRGQAVFERRADNLQATLDRIGADLGSASAVLDKQVEEHSGDWVDFQADDIFYATKGRLYAYGLLLRELEIDFAQVIAERDLKAAWDQMVQSFEVAASLKPLVVVNGRPDAFLRPSHLAAQGFFLLRARTQLLEISNILQK
ncbi:MAG TPA: DUF2333 family protein [Hypericibacter adhaerens]|jgi:hypothetical protein|uniref:DUF2333 domain-containing protein n=1 Tax=Hypericibacter adhaerens TaxID=2602016 RepID=A0A5J6N8E1_9PROT|nr:DUF2333 family protein [Hypericibacter adhaerens]QEX25273.1 hypothetical protein FRZ61_52200 [Hypericibacter adhaerens]HWA44293.1 DUF2333 family protein [Hypericibacter adhaerens]